MLSGVLQLPLAPSHCGDQDIGAKTSSTVCMMKTRMPWELELPAPPRSRDCVRPLQPVLWFPRYHLPGVGAFLPGAIRIPLQMYRQG